MPRSHHYLAVATERPTLANPFSFAEPVEPAHFVGRADLFARLEETLGAATPAPVFLVGPKGAGKSSILHKLAAGESALPYRFVYIACDTLTFQDGPDFLWGLARKITQALEGLTFASPPFARSALVTYPGRTFRERFLDPLLENLEQSGLVLMLDDAQPLLEEDAGRMRPRRLRELLAELDEAEEKVRLLFTLAGGEETVGRSELEPLPTQNIMYMQPFTLAETQALLQARAPFKVHDEIARYLHALSQGHPLLVQQLAHSLFERWQERGLGQITCADLMVIARTQFGGALAGTTATACL